ncbi:MAG TPA: hypothetical protein VFA12_02175 [Stellaceae bacterium]|nr:hypothetical protein [Stellaceae bacterium]
MARRTLAATIAAIAFAIPAFADEPTPASLATPRLPAGWDGTSCQQDSDCHSHHCAANWDGGHYCARADLNCAFPATAGVRAGFTKTNYGVIYTCEAGGSWQTGGRALAYSKPAKTTTVLAGRSTATNGSSGSSTPSHADASTIAGAGDDDNGSGGGKPHGSSKAASAAASSPRHWEWETQRTRKSETREKTAAAQETLSPPSQPVTYAPAPAQPTIYPPWPPRPAAPPPPMPRMYAPYSSQRAMLPPADAEPYAYAAPQPAEAPAYQPGWRVRFW